jgi:tetratricopeptide (TPR) repeat protein
MIVLAMLAKNERLRTVFACGLLAFATIAVYWPVTHFDFINLDDRDYVSRNPVVAQGLNWRGMQWAFQTGHAANWHPLTWLSHMLDVQLFGMNPGAHHRTNVFFHAANTVLLFLVLRRMTNGFWQSMFVAALFAVHPLHVESVAWIAERKDVLSTFFGFLSLWTYARYAEDVSFSKVDGPRLSPTAAGTRCSEGHENTFTFHVSRMARHPSFPYLLSFAFFACSLMSKPMLVTFPLLLLLLDYWPLRRFSSLGQFRQQAPRLVAEKAPFLALSVLSSIITFVIQQRGGTVASLQNLSIGQRLGGAMLAYAHYLRKMFWPHPLAAFYPLERQWTPAALGGAVLLVLAISILAFATRRHRPWFAVGWLWFLGALVPVIGLIQVGAQAAADRYTYVPLVGLFIAATWGLCDLMKTSRYKAAFLASAASVCIAVCTGITFVQASYWRSTERLCDHALSVTKENFLAHAILGTALLEKGQTARARTELEAGLQIYPGFPMALSELGRALIDEDKDDQALALCRQTLEVFPRNAVAHCLMGRLLARQKKFESAAEEFSEAVRSDPALAEAHYELAYVLARRGNPNAALPHALAALRLSPDAPEAHFCVGNVLLAQGKPAEALPLFENALKLRPIFPEARLKCANALLDLHRLVEAEGQLLQILASEPNNLEAHRLQAQIYSAEGKSRELVEQYRRMLQLAPDWPEVLNNLAWVLATHTDVGLRNGAEAVSLAERAVDLTAGTNTPFLATLAAAYAEAGRFGEAISVQQKVCDVAVAGGRTGQRGSFQQRLQLYRSGQPYREP